MLQPARTRADGTSGLAVSDFFDFSVYVDADDDDVRDWYVHRFLALRDTAFRDPRSYFTRYADSARIRRFGRRHTYGTRSTGPTSSQNIRPTRSRATAILRKGTDHRVEWVRIRKV